VTIDPSRLAAHYLTSAEMLRLMFQHWMLTKADPTILIETGTLKAQNVVRLAPWFQRAYSIELSPDLWRAAREKYGLDTEGGIYFLLGDSAELLPELLKRIRKPVVLYLDAHYCADDQVAASEFPLWAELEAIRRHSYADLVIVDDVHNFGKKRPDLAVHESGRAWEHVTRESVLEALGDRVIKSYVHRDQFIVHCQKGGATRTDVCTPQGE
jgi:hypothetical protein